MDKKTRERILHALKARDIKTLKHEFRTNSKFRTFVLLVTGASTLGVGAVVSIRLRIILWNAIRRFGPYLIMNVESVLGIARRYFDGPSFEELMQARRLEVFVPEGLEQDERFLQTVSDLLRQIGIPDCEPGVVSHGRFTYSKLRTEVAEDIWKKFYDLGCLRVAGNA